MLLFLVTALSVSSVLNVNASIKNSEGPTLNRHKRLVGGYDTEIKDHPHQVGILHDGWTHCGGTILSKHYVLTAAHCLSNKTHESLVVRSGSSLIYGGGTMHQIEEIIIHKSFLINEYNNSNYDIGLIRVKEPFVYDETRQPAKLNRKAFPKRFRTDEKATVIGWGFTRYEQDKNVTATDQLQALELPLISKTKCNSIYKPFGGIYQGQICAGYSGVRNKDICYGDSGSSLTWRGKVIGIVAYMEGECGKLDYPSVYTEVAYFIPWIKKYAEFD